VVITTIRRQKKGCAFFSRMLERNTVRTLVALPVNKQRTASSLLLLITTVASASTCLFLLCVCVVAFLVVLLFGWFPLIFWLSVLLPGFSGLDLVFFFLFGFCSIPLSLYVFRIHCFTAFVSLQATVGGGSSQPNIRDGMPTRWRCAWAKVVLFILVNLPSLPT